MWLDFSLFDLQMSLFKLNLGKVTIRRAKRGYYVTTDLWNE